MLVIRSRLGATLTGVMGAPYDPAMPRKSLHGDERVPWSEGLPADLLQRLHHARWVVDVSDDPLIVLASVQEWARIRQEIERLAVQDARREGATWEQIGAALGVPRQAAHRKWASLIDAPAEDEGEIPPDP